MTLSGETKVAFQGEHGAYSEQAAFDHFGESISTIPCSTFEEVFTAVEKGRAKRGLIPIENSLAGSVHRNYDLLLRYELSIVGEAYLRVHHCLMALPGTDLTDVHEVRSHPQALAQCERFVNELGQVQIKATYDTAGSARSIRERELQGVAAVAASRAAEVYELEVLARGIEDDPSNFTRFLALAGEPAVPQEDAKTSIAFSLVNEPGVLYRALGVFASRGIDLTKIESRPLVGKPWEYMFYLDLAGSSSDPPHVGQLPAIAAGPVRAGKSVARA